MEKISQYGIGRSSILRLAQTLKLKAYAKDREKDHLSNLDGFYGCCYSLDNLLCIHFNL
jgi:hypothetical protein